MSAELIERLEKATGPDRELDFALYVTVERGEDFADHKLNHQFAHLLPRYTSSIDEALTLAVPLGWSWRVGNLPSGRGFADLGTQKSLQCVEGATPAIALCIAALKARDGTPEQRGL